MTKKEMIRRIAAELDLDQTLTKKIVQRCLDCIIKVVITEGRIELRDFGVFEIRERAPRIAQNPKTLERVPVPAKKTVKFKVGRLMKLALIGGQGLELAVPGCGDIDDKAGNERVVLHVGEDRTRSVRLAFTPARETRVITGVGHQPVGAAVVRMTVARSGSEDELGPEPTQHPDEDVLLRLPRAQGAVAEVEKLDRCRPQGSSRHPGLVLPLLGRSPCSRLSSSQMEDADLAAMTGQKGNGAATAQLHIIRMSSDGESVQSHLFHFQSLDSTARLPAGCAHRGEAVRTGP